MAGAEERCSAEDEEEKEDTGGREAVANTYDADVKKPVKTAGTISTGLIAASVAAERTNGRRAGPAEGTETDSKEVEGMTAEGTNDERLAIGEAWKEDVDGVVPARKGSLRRTKAAVRAEAQVGCERRHETKVRAGDSAWCWEPRTVTRIFPGWEYKDTAPHPNWQRSDWVRERNQSHLIDSVYFFQAIITAAKAHK